MYYQLPNGKVVQMSVDECLNLKHKDIQYLLSINAGEYINNPWTDSAISRSKNDIIDPVVSDKSETVNVEQVEELETFFDDYFPEEFEDPDPNIDLNFQL